MVLKGFHKAFQTKSGTALYFNHENKTYYTTNYGEVRDALRHDLFSDDSWAKINAYNILTIWDEYWRALYIPEELRVKIQTEEKRIKEQLGLL